MTQENVSILNRIDNFELSSHYTRNTPNGGTCILVREGTIAINRKDICRLSVERVFECSGIEIVNKSKGGRNVVIICIYRTPDSNKRGFLETLDSLLFMLKKELKQKDVVICGDFNINGAENSAYSRELVSILNSYGFNSLINSTTHFTVHSETQIDYIATNFLVNPQHTANILLGLSSHTAQLAALPDNLFVHKLKPQTVRKRIFSKQNKVNFKLELASIDWEAILKRDGYQCVDKSFSVFSCEINRAFESNFPIKTVRVKRDDCKPWLTKGIKISLINKREMNKAAKQSRNILLIERCKKYSKILKKVIKASKKSLNDRKIRKAENKVKVTWDIIKNESGRKQTKHPIQEIKVNGKSISDRQTIEQAFNDFFLKEPLELAPGACPEVAMNHLLNFRPPVASTMFLSPTNEKEVSNAIMSLKTKQSSGWDELSSDLLKFCCDEISYPLTYLINCSFLSGIFPEKLKYTIIKPLHKKEDRLQIRNYRPISLVSVISKVFEKIFLSRLIDFLNKWDILDSSQHGFRQGRSTDSALFDFTNAVLGALDGSQSAVGVFCDLSKAFDCVDHSLLLNKLSHYGIRGVTFTWIKSFLSGRKQKVNISNIRGQSSWLETKVGVPQGCILSPVLFLLYINDLNYLKRQCKICLYADDVSILVRGEAMQHVLLNLSITLKECSKWFEANGLYLNSSKTTAMNFKISSRHEPLIKEIDLSLTSKISIFPEIKFLGIYIDENLSWAYHINQLLKKLSSAAYAINILKDTCSLEVLIDVYRGYYESLVRYGIAFWGSSPLLDRIFKAQKNMIRRIFSLGWSQSCRGVFLQHKILTVPSIYIFSVLVMIFKNIKSLSKENESQRVTRANKLLFYPIHKTAKFETGALYKGIKMFNSLPDELKCCQVLSQFKRKLNRFLVENSFYSVKEFLEFGVL